MAQYLIITNNPKVFDGLSQQYAINYLADGSYLSVLENARDLIHQGAKLLSHPLVGSMKPNQTPYRSLLLETSHLPNGTLSQTRRLDIESLDYIESSLAAANTFLSDRALTDWPELIRRDFQTVDYSLFHSAIKRI